MQPSAWHQTGMRSQELSHCVIRSPGAQLEKVDVCTTRKSCNLREEEIRTGEETRQIPDSRGGDGVRESLMKVSFGMDRENGSGMEMGRDRPVGVNGGRKAEGRKERGTQAIKTGAPCSGSFLQGKRDKKAAITDSSSFFCCFLFCF